MRVFALLSILLALTLPSALLADPFQDVPPGHWAYEAVEKLTRAGILEGFSDDTFRGSEPVSRFAFAVSLAKALQAAPALRAGKEVPVDEAARADLARLVGEFDAELELLGVKVGAVDEKLERYRDENEALRARIEKLEQGDVGPVHFAGGELRLAAFNRPARSSLFTLILDTDFRAHEHVSGTLRLQFSNALDGRLVENVDAYEAWADITGLGKSLRRLRAGRFNYFLGTGQVLMDRVEGFDLAADHGRNRYSAFYGDDIILQLVFPTFAEGEMGYYYIRRAIDSAGHQPLHLGLFLRGPLGDRVQYGFEFSDFDNQTATPSNLNRRTRGYLATLDVDLGTKVGIRTALISQEEDFRGFSVDHDLSWRSSRYSPLEDVLQALDTFSDGATLDRNEINGFTDLKLGAKLRPFGPEVELYAGLDDVQDNSSFFDNSRSEFQVWTAAITRFFEKGDANLQFRMRRLVFDDEDPTRQAGTLPVARNNGLELRLQYYTRI